MLKRWGLVLCAIYSVVTERALQATSSPSYIKKNIIHPRLKKKLSIELFDLHTFPDYFRLFQMNIAEKHDIISSQTQVLGPIVRNYSTFRTQLLK